MQIAVALGFRLAASSPCPKGTARMAESPGNWTVCEDVTKRRGQITFLGPDGSTLANIGKSAEQLFVNESSCYLNFTKAEVQAAKDDILGDKLLAMAGEKDVTLLDVMRTIPPLVYDGGFNKMDPINCADFRAHSMPCKTWSSDFGHNGHTFVRRESR